MKMNTIRIGASTFEILRVNGDMKEWTPYAVEHEGGTTHYAWSPDGVGVYWYDTLDELLENH